MKVISLVILLSLMLFAGDFYAASGTGGSGQNNSQSGTGGSTGANATQGGVSNGTRSIQNPRGAQRGASTSSAVGQNFDTRNLNQTQLQTLLQNQSGTGTNRLTFQTNRGTINLTPSQINQMNANNVLQILNSLNVNNPTSPLSGINLSNISDANLRTQLFDLIDSNNLGQQIDIQVRNGVVTLSGFVVSQAEADQLVQTLSALNLRNLNLQESDLRLLSNPDDRFILNSDNRFVVNSGANQFSVDPQTGIVSNNSVSPNNLTTAGNNLSSRLTNNNAFDLRNTTTGNNNTAITTTDGRAGSSDTLSDPRLNVFGNTDPRAGNNQTDIMRNFNSPTTFGNNTNTANTAIGTGNTGVATNNLTSVNDSDLRLNILNLLDTNGISSNNLVVESNSGNITLSGFASPLEADRIIQLIRSLNVDQINLNLTLLR